MSRAWFHSNMMLRIEVHQTRVSCFSQSEGPLGALLQIPSVFSCVFTEERIEFGHTAIKHRSVQCCIDVCPFVSFFHLLPSSMELKSDHQLLGHLYNQAPSPSIAQFGQEASSRKSPSCSKRLPLWIMLATCFCEPSVQQIFFLNSSPDLCLDASLFLNSTGSYFDLRAWFLLWYAFSAVRPFLRGVCLSKSYSFNWIWHSLSHSKCSNIYKRYECSWAKFQGSQKRVWILMQWNHFSFFISNKFAKLLQTCFCFVIMVYGV